MNTYARSIRIGTRASALARWQAGYVSRLLQSAWADLEIHIQIFTTRGDQALDVSLPSFGGQGVFTSELEAALNRKEIDFAVHSLKDLPTEVSPDLVIGAIPPRASPGDALISREGYTLATLPYGAIVGTSSRRRAAQLLYRRPDLRIRDIRGNVDTRIRKALEPASNYDAIVLAIAGLERLGQTGLITEKLSLIDMLPAPGQGALAVQCRNEDEALKWLLPLNHFPTELAVTAERSFLAGLGGGCSLPIAAYGEFTGNTLQLRGRITARNGSEQIDLFLSGPAELSAAREIGKHMAAKALGNGVARLLDSSN